MKDLVLGTMLLTAASVSILILERKNLMKKISPVLLKIKRDKK
jgi:hypothetical protein